MRPPCARPVESQSQTWSPSPRLGVTVTDLELQAQTYRVIVTDPKSYSHRPTESQPQNGIRSHRLKESKPHTDGVKSTDLESQPQTHGVTAQELESQTLNDGVTATDLESQPPLQPTPLHQPIVTTTPPPTEGVTGGRQ